MGPTPRGGRGDQHHTHQHPLSARNRLPAAMRATTDAAEALDGLTTVLLAVPSQTLRTNLEGVARPARRRRHPGQPGEGHRTGQPDADESGHRPGHRGRSQPGRGGLGPQPRRRDRRRATRRHRGGLHRLWPCGRPAARVEHRLLPAVHQRRRHRHRNRWCLQERHRAGLRHGGRSGAGGEHRCGDHHPRPGRDHAAGNRRRRQARDAGRSRRGGRSGRHLHVAALAQPQLR